MQQQNKQTNYLIKIRMFDLRDLKKAEKNKFLKLKKNNLNYTLLEHTHTLPSTQGVWIPQNNLVKKW